MSSTPFKFRLHLGLYFELLQICCTVGCPKNKQQAGNLFEKTHKLKRLTNIFDTLALFSLMKL